MGLKIPLGMEWRKSTLSTTVNCVMCSHVADESIVRVVDSKGSFDEQLRFSSSAWVSFVASVVNDR